ncbi:MAG: M23 family metallopeptidase [Pseudomonadota bacterium]
MQIILLHPRFTQAKSLTLTHRHVVLILLLFLGAVAVGAILLHHFSTRYGADLRSPFPPDPRTSRVDDETTRKDRYVKENLAAMAMKLGEMQAQLMRLDALGERVQGLSGIKPEEFNFKEPPGRGGADVSASTRGSHALDMAQFQRALDALARDVEYRADYMNVVETALIREKVQFKMLPTIQPVNVSYNASGFGWRIDPFSGRSSFHEGIDFPAPTGTPIVAAAGGVVIAAEYHHQFGNLLEIDHGNELVTRYAHASKLMVTVGDIVKRGQHVANIGSTGRSTGAHLHFEVLVKGMQQNPNKFLAAGAAQAKLAAQFAK